MTFNSNEAVVPLLRSLAKVLEVRPDNVQVSVGFVDTSGDESIGETIGQYLPSALVSVDTNVGFARGVNRCLDLLEERAGTCDVVTLLNPDVEFEASDFWTMLMLLVDRGYSIVSPDVRDATGSRDRGSGRRFWTLRTLVAEAAGAPSLAMLLGGRRRQVALPQSGVAPVPMVSGSFMLVSRRIFGDGLNTELPMYLEDQELCIRANKDSADSVVIAAGVKVLHRGAESRTSISPASAVSDLFRVLELAEAPALAYELASGRNWTWARAAIGIGSVLRPFGAAAATILRRRRIVWVREQVHLSLLLLRWAAGRYDVARNTDLSVLIDSVRDQTEGGGA